MSEGNRTPGVCSVDCEEALLCSGNSFLYKAVFLNIADQLKPNMDEDKDGDANRHLEMDMNKDESGQGCVKSNEDKDIKDPACGGMNEDTEDTKADQAHGGYSSGDHDQASGVNFLSRVNTLKPQIDKIFSEVLNQIPDIDFESGNQSDDEPIFSYQIVESKASAVFDDKDQDTSENPDLQLVSSENLPSQSFEAGAMFDNDLAAFCSTLQFPTEEEIKNWKILAMKMEDSEAEIEVKEEADLKRSQKIGHSESSMTNAEQSFVSQNASGDLNNSEAGADNVRIPDNNRVYRQDYEKAASDPTNSVVPETVQRFQQRLQEGIETLVQTEPQRMFSKAAQNGVDDIVSTFKLHEPTILSKGRFEELDIDLILNAVSENNNPLENVQIPSQPSSPRSRSCDGRGDQAATGLTLIQKLAQLSVESGADAESLKSLDPHTGAVRTSPGLLVEQTANSTMADKSHISDASCQVSGTGTTSVGTSTASVGTSTASVGTSTASVGTSTASVGTSTTSVGTSTTSVGTSTSGIENSRLPHRHQNDADSEPPTVNDLQKLRQQDEERRGMTTVLRVLRLPAGQSEADSSSDDDDDEMVDSDWRQTRQKLKDDIVKGAVQLTGYIVHDASTGDIVLDASTREDLVHDASTREDLVHDASTREDLVHDASTRDDIVYKDSTREDNVHDASTREDKVHDVSTRENIVHDASVIQKQIVHGASSSSVESQADGATNGVSLQESTSDTGISIEIQTEPMLGAMASSEQLVQVTIPEKPVTGKGKKKKGKKDVNLDQLMREDKNRAERLEKERKRKQEIKDILDGARSTASTLGTQPAGENTPTVFDFDISFEDPIEVLPRTLHPDRELLLLMINLSSNGKAVPHSRASQSTVTDETYTFNGLLAYFLGFVPTNENVFLLPVSSCNNANVSPAFYVVGLQQLYFEDALKLYLAVTPSECFESHYYLFHKYIRGAKIRDVKGVSRFASFLPKFLANQSFDNCNFTGKFQYIEVKSSQPEDKGATPYVYRQVLPTFSSKPLSTYVQVHPDPQAARKIFSIPMGFHWQTVDNDEVLHSSGGCFADAVNNTEITMSVIYPEALNVACIMINLLCRIYEEGLDVAGVRLLYPTHAQLLKWHDHIYPRHALENIKVVLAVGIRGAVAKGSWLRAVGTPNPATTQEADLNALYARLGSKTESGFLLYCPRSASCIQPDLAKWFGGRVPRGATPISLGKPYEKEEGKVKRGKKSSTKPLMTVQRPPVVLTAVTRSDAFLVVSPLCPPSYFGIVMTIWQRKGYWLRSVTRVRLTPKLAGTLGISEEMQKFFCPGVHSGEKCSDSSAEAIAVSTVFMISNENAGHHVGNLIHDIMMGLTHSGLLGIIESRINERPITEPPTEPLTSKHLFHGSAYTEKFLEALGRQMSLIPEENSIPLRLMSFVRTSNVIHQNQEQVAVVTFIGKEFLLMCGPFLARILNIPPLYLALSLQPLPDRFELLGLKCIPSLARHQVRHLSPYGENHQLWEQTTQMLISEPALAVVLRGVNIYSILTPVIQQYQHALENEVQPMSGETQAMSGEARPRASSSTCVQKIQCTISSCPKETDELLRSFFFEDELYPDPYARRLLPFVHESRLYIDVLERQERGQSLRSFTMKPFTKMDLTKEDMVQAIIGQPPITTAMIIKPRAVQRWLTTILKSLVKAGFTIVGLRQLMFSARDANSFIPLAHKKDKKNHKKHVEAYTSGPAVVLALKRANAVKVLYDIVGPNDPVLSRHHRQFTWRAEFGTDIFNNALYCSVNYWDAVRDVKRLFPNGLCCDSTDILASEEIPAPGKDTIVDIRPDARDITFTSDAQEDNESEEAKARDVANRQLQTTCVILNPRMMNLNLCTARVSGLIMLDFFLAHGFKIVGARLVWLTREQADRLIEITDTTYRVLDTRILLCGGPVLALAMERNNAVVGFDAILTQDRESITMMEYYGDELFKPTGVEMAHSLLKMFFDRLLPGSQLTITSRDGEERQEVAGLEAGQDDGSLYYTAQIDPAHDHGAQFDRGQDHGVKYDPAQEHDPAQNNGSQYDPDQDHGAQYGSAQDHGAQYDSAQDHRARYDPHGARYDPHGARYDPHGARYLPHDAGYNPHGAGYDPAENGAGYDTTEDGAGYDPAEDGAGYDPAEDGAGYDRSEDGAGLETSL